MCVYIILFVPKHKYKTVDLFRDASWSNGSSECDLFFQDQHCKVVCFVVFQLQWEVFRHLNICERDLWKILFVLVDTLSISSFFLVFLSKFLSPFIGMLKQSSILSNLNTWRPKTATRLPDCKDSKSCLYLDIENHINMNLKNAVP